MCVFPVAQRAVHQCPNVYISWMVDRPAACVSQCVLQAVCVGNGTVRVWLSPVRLLLAPSLCVYPICLCVWHELPAHMYTWNWQLCACRRGRASARNLFMMNSFCVLCAAFDCRRGLRVSFSQPAKPETVSSVDRERGGLLADVTQGTRAGPSTGVDMGEREAPKRLGKPRGI